MREVWTDGGAESVERLRSAVLAALDGGPAVLPLDTRNPAAHDLRAAMSPDEPVETGTAVIIPTSGSTGEPKGVLLSADALLASASAALDRLGGSGRWLLATPAHYIGGLQVVLRAHLAGGGPVILDTTAGFRADAFALATDTLRGQPGPHYTALVPTQLARLVEAGGAAVRAAAAYDAIVLGGAALDERLRQRCAESGIRVVSSYGMSETAGGCVYEGVPLDEVRVRLGDGGRVEIAGPVLAHGYRLRPELTASTFADGWFRTSDLGRLRNGRLEVLGRLDDVLNTGGVKVPAATVERALTACPGVRAACVVGLPDPEWGQRVVAALVVRGEPDLDRLRAAAREAAGAAGVPKRFEFLPELPLRGPGKIDRAAVRALLSDS